MTATLSFFITGMITGLIYHRADYVPIDSISIVIDMFLTCLITFSVTAPFARAALRRDKTGGIIEAKTSFEHLLSRLSRHPFGLCVLLGACTFLFLSAVVAAIFGVLQIRCASFYPYIFAKSIFGASVTVSVLYAGIFRIGKSTLANTFIRSEISDTI